MQDGNEYDAKIVDMDTMADLALLKVNAVSFIIIRILLLG